MKMIGMNYKWTRFCPGFAEQAMRRFLLTVTRG